MKISKKIFLIFTLVSILVVLFGSFCLAQKQLEVVYPNLEVPGVKTPTTTKTALPEYLKYVFTFAIMIAGLLAFGALIYGGFSYLTSAGDPSKMKEGRDQIMAGFLGLIIVLSSYLILNTINPQLVILESSIEPGKEGIKIYTMANCQEDEEHPSFMVNQSMKDLTDPDLNWGLDGDKITSIKFLGDPGSLSVTLCSDTEFKSCDPPVDYTTEDTQPCKPVTPTTYKSISLDWHIPGVYLYASDGCTGDKYGLDYVIFQSNSATLPEFDNKTQSIKFIYGDKDPTSGEYKTKYAAILHEKENFMGQAALFDQEQNTCLSLSDVVALNSSPNRFSKPSNLVGISSCEAAVPDFPYIDSISPVSQAPNTAFTLRIEGTYFFISTIYDPIIRFAGYVGFMPETRDKSPTRKGGDNDSGWLEYDVPSSFFPLNAAGNWEISVIAGGAAQSNSKILTISATCASLGGFCCSDIGKVCLPSSKKSGASDCSECCRMEEDCITGTCSWQDDECGDPCEVTKRHQTCGPPGCTGGSCTAGTTRCISDAACVAPPPPSEGGEGGGYGANLSGAVSSITVYLKPIGESIGDGVRFGEDKNYTEESCRLPETGFYPAETKIANLHTYGEYCGGYDEEEKKCKKDADCGDRISSMEMDGHYVALLFRDPDYKGDCEVFMSSDPDFRSNRIGQCGWLGRSDCLSSFIIKARK